MSIRLDTLHMHRLEVAIRLLPVYQTLSEPLPRKLAILTIQEQRHFGAQRRIFLMAMATLQARGLLAVVILKVLLRLLALATCTTNLAEEQAS